MDIRKITVGKLTYELPLSGKFNVITGDNATGKTTMLNLLNIDKFGGRSKSVGIISDYGNLRDVEESCDDFVWIIDESTLYTFKATELDTMMKSKSRFIIISRAVPEILPINYKDVYEYYTSGKYYKATRMYLDYDIIPKCGSYVIEGEEGKTESQYCNKWLPSVISAGGNSKAVTFREADCIILDGAACGGLMEEILTFQNIYLPISFEERIYNKLFPKHVMSNNWWVVFPSLERYYTCRLIEDGKAIGINYSKSSALSDKILKLNIYDIGSLLDNAILKMGG